MDHDDHAGEAQEEIPPHHNSFRRWMAGCDSRCPPYEAFASLEEARRHPDALASLDTDGHSPFATFPVRLVGADEPALDQLLTDLDELAAASPDVAGRSRRERVRYEPAAVLAHHCWVPSDRLWLHVDVAGFDLHEAVEDVFRGATPRLDPRAMARAELMVDWWSAAERGDVEGVSSLLDRGVRVDAGDSWGRTALLAAARYGYAELVRLLLDRGADPNAEGHAYGTPTTAAVYGCARLQPDPEGPLILEMVLAAGGRKGLREAVMLGDADLARRLLDEDPTIDVSGDAGCHHSYSYLMIAAEYGGLDVARLLLDRGADVASTDDDIGVTALSVAACCGRVEITALLLDHGAAIDHVDALGMTPLDNAVDRGEPAVVRLLIERGARRGLLDAIVAGDDDRIAAEIRSIAEQGGSRYCFLIQSACKLAVAAGHVDALTRLLDVSADDFIHESDLAKLPGLAAALGRLEIVKLLIARGADPGRADAEGLTPLARAEAAGQAEVARYLRSLDRIESEGSEAGR